MAEAPPAGRDIGPVEIITSCATLLVLGIVQPVLNLLGDNPEFFVAADATRAEVVLLALVAGILLPILVGLVVLCAYSLNGTAGRLFHGAVLTVLAGVLAAVILRHTPLGSLPGPVQLLLAFLLGLVSAVAYFRFEPVRSLLVFGSVAVLAVPAFFLFLSPASRLVTASDAVAVAGVVVADPPPIVMVMFDEFPVASLIDGEGELQSDLYPAFARLAGDATWYRNAVTTARLTQWAVPAALTGYTPDLEETPTAFDHPRNLFTLLGGVYDVDAMEPITALCPPLVCEESPLDPVPNRERWRAMAADLRVVAAHMLLPEDLTRSLPPIDQAWGAFAEVADVPAEPVAGFSDPDAVRALFNEAVRAGRKATFEGFVDGIDVRGERPTLDFIHVMLPHGRWEYLPDGRSFVPPRPQLGADGNTWLSDPWPVNQVYQRHLLQVQFVDTLIGRLIARLEALGIYDETLLVVAADHGIVFRPDVENRRAATEDSVGEIAAIPLFIKTPRQETGGIDDYRAEIHDILPTMADAIGLALPWEVEGTSLLATDRPERSGSTIVGGGTVDFGAGGEEKLAAAARKVEIFRGGTPYDLVPDGTADLLGVAVDQFPSGTSPLVASAEGAQALADVDISAAVLPIMIRGTLERPEVGSDPALLAVGVNGVVVAVTRSHQSADDPELFDVLLPPSSLVSGSNQIDILLVDGDPGDRTLTRIGP